MENQVNPAPNREQIGQEIHQVEEIIHLSRLAIGSIRQQNPVNYVEIQIKQAVIREAHRRRHELNSPLRTVKEAEEGANIPAHAWKYRSKSI